VRCTLLYNPESGRKRSRRAVHVQNVANALRSLGHSVELAATTAPGSATAQAKQAVISGAEIVFACGGDGTIHEVLQALVSESGKNSAALGIIPLGSANALARHMRLSLDPVQAALQQIACEPQTIPIGKIEWDGQVRYFAVMAGAGPDGALVYDMLTSHKSSLGRLAYYLRAARLFAAGRFGPFQVEYVDADSGRVLQCSAVSAMGVRVRTLGGLFHRLTDRRVSLENTGLQLLVLKPPAWLSLPLWFVSGWAGLGRQNGLLRSVNVKTFSCSASSIPSPHFQADGEWLGRVPMKVSLVENALCILRPE
jgi:diacylglycerol kinase family enzyme